MENRISYRVSHTRLFKEKDELGISFAWETLDEVVFSKVESENDLLADYYIAEKFKTGEIVVYTTDGKIVDKTDRILNLFRLKI